MPPPKKNKAKDTSAGAVVHPQNEEKPVEFKRSDNPTDDDVGIKKKEARKKGEGNKSNEGYELIAWQNKLLPFMVIVPVLLVTTFIVLATIQMTKFDTLLDEKPDSALMARIIPASGEVLSQDKAKWETLTFLEQQSLDKRYRQGGLLLMSRIYTKYLGFFTGMLMAIVGAVFIIGKLSIGRSSVNMSAKDLIKANVVTTSPGIIFGVLGTVLMALTILQHNDITVQDSPLYLSPQAIAALSLKSGNVGDTTGQGKIDPKKVFEVFPGTQPSPKDKKKTKLKAKPQQ